MDEQFTFWYPVLIEVQLDFEGREHNHEILLLGHIVHNEVLMCRESREKLMNESKADKEKKVVERVAGTKVCQVCQDEYRKHPDSPYYKWVAGLGNEAKTQEKVVASLQDA